MPVVSPEKLAALQRNSLDVRNICILAHVDHGKTSLTDALIATNGIISPKLAGKIRYLDSRPDEQLRGITMESSAISLCFSMARRSITESEPQQKDFLINLIDSPGHVDFSSEVSTASRLCDGAVVLVDAVEGVCSQTVTVLRQAWIERLKPILVINKMDRLVTELKMSPSEAYSHLTKLLEQVNAVLGSFFQGERMEEDLLWREKIDQRLATSAAREQAKRNGDESADQEVTDDTLSSVGGNFEERDDEDLYFAPERNNVIFSSAIDGWAFTTQQFARFYEKKLGIKRSVLEKVLWGEFYLDPKTKRVLKSRTVGGRSLKPVFVQLVLSNIWAVYEATTGGNSGKGDPSVLDKITKTLGITIPPHVLRSKDPRVLMTTVFAAWLPLSTALLVSVVEQLPSPPEAQAQRSTSLVESSPASAFVDSKLTESMKNFKTSSQDPVIAFVSKMVSVPVSELEQNKRRSGGSLSAEEARELARKKRAEIAKAQAAAEDQSRTPNSLPGALDGLSMNNQSTTILDGDQTEDSAEPEELIGFARLFSGRLAVGDEIFVLPPKFSPANPYATPEPEKITVSSLYMLMGRSLEPLKLVPAGVVFGIGGLSGSILKSGTLCSQVEGGVNLAGVSMGGEPIVRVALEPVNPADLDRMIEGMRLLERSDPCARYEMLESGEHVIVGAGELHLERCLNDLRERFARCEIQVGEPIVPYRESIVNAAEMATIKSKDMPRGTVVGTTASKQVTIRLRTRPLPASLTEYLERHRADVRCLYHQRQEAEGTNTTDQQGLETERVNDMDHRSNDDSLGRECMSLTAFRNALKKTLDEETKEQKDFWAKAIDEIATFGPRHTGPNILIDATSGGTCRKFLQESELDLPSELSAGTRHSWTRTNEFSDRISYAFQLATAQGPLCNEPVQGVAVFLETVSISQAENSDETSAIDNAGRLTSEIIRVVRDSIRQGFLDWSPRLLLAVYNCEIQASTEVLGRVYGVVTRRRGRIVSETIKEGTPFFTITAVIPVAESFGFSDEIRKRTSGAASPQLRFAGFELLDEDPFWVPSTEDELEDLGEIADRENVAKRYMDGVRKRKGLVIRGGKRMEGEKGRTLKK